MSQTQPCLYGIAAAFEDEEALLQAVRRVRAAGYRHLRAYTPFPVDGLAEALGPRRNWMGWIVLAGGLVGLILGYGIQYFTAVVDYPFDVAGRAPHSWVAFLPVTIEVALLVAAGSALVGMLLLNGLPQPYHPIFNLPGFGRASESRFFLCIRGTDPKFRREETARFLRSLGARQVNEVEC